MGVAGMLLVLASTLSVTFAPLLEQAGAKKQPGEQASGLEIVKLEISVKRVPILEESSEPRGDPGTLQQRQLEYPTPRDNGRNPADAINPRYDRNGQVIRPNTDARTLDPKRLLDTRSNRYRFIASLVVTNTGEKTIRGVNWDYVLIDSNTNKELRRYGFHNRTKISPGETATFVQDVRPSAADRRAEITRIDFADGTHWQRAHKLN
jgi:hypothetical protein